MIIVGVYGVIGSGKSTSIDKLINNYYKNIAYHISCDLIGKRLLNSKEVFNFISKNFENVIQEKEIIKNKLRNLIFNDFKANELYANFIWPIISNEVEREIKLISESNKSIKVIFVEASILSGISTPFNFKILFKPSFFWKHKYYNNILNRDIGKTNKKQIKNIIKFQKYKNKYTKYDFKIKSTYKKHNNKTLILFKKIVDKFI
ncbi:dephospho-CoA kinase [Spiroplasma litorale]|uniref:Dephospho-CoA kinase n=1 Tax=Spiroplasma litorale TaxID=216942 RepID=A0A0K1W1C7_9MOLU|nr:dephospho-CoA kinase [Spiroplasma litorale]AKX34129.1 dephospho-CoA kinase [Spiroplasma litorale]